MCGGGGGGGLDGRGISIFEPHTLGLFGDSKLRISHVCVCVCLCVCVCVCVCKKK